MNLHQIVSGAIGAVNPFVDGEIRVSDGAEPTDAAGHREPKYKPIVRRPMQVQPLQFRDIAQLDGLNLQGTRRKIYINGAVDGLVRPDNKGGDLITMPDRTVWLVAVVAEAWPDWCTVLCTLQNGS